MIKSAIEQAIREALRELGAPEAIFAVEYPPKEARADYATNAALAAAKQLGKSPREVADALTEALLEARIARVEKIEIAGPGFINFTLDRQFFAETVTEVGKQGDMWGRNGLLNGKEILVEYTSPNLFKPLHIGNLVGNILGESISRLMEASGATVRRLNYPSDIGLTVAKGVWGLQKNRLNPENILELGKAYVLGNAAYEEGGKEKEEIDAINKLIYAGTDAELNRLRETGIETSRRHLDALCEKLGTVFDAEFFESQSGVLGRDIVSAHVEDGVFEKSEGAVVYRGEQDGLHTRVFLNSQGLPTYEAKEVGLFQMKSERYPHFSRSLTVTGGEQTDFFKVVFAALRKLFAGALSGREMVHIPNGFLTLTTGKMSSRKGNIITGESLIEDTTHSAIEKMQGRELADKEAVAEHVAIAAIKYAVLKQGTGRDIVFDPEQSLSFEGESGPYLQYAHVRTSSVLRKAAAEGVHAAATSLPAEISAPEKILHRFPEIVERAAREYEPHHVAQYLMELSSAFSTWYASTHIIDGTPEAAYKVAVVGAVGQTLRNGLSLLGIKAPEEM